MARILQASFRIWQRKSCLKHSVASGRAGAEHLLSGHDFHSPAQQIIEKSWEHRTKSFLSFIDLKKAHDSVPRDAMWLALRKLGVPEKTV